MSAGPPFKSGAQREASPPGAQTGAGEEDGLIQESCLRDVREVVLRPTSSPMDVYTALSQLRKLVLTHGTPAQRQVCTDVLYTRIQCMLLDEGADSAVTEACCRVLCSLVARNVVTSAIVLDQPAIVERLFQVVKEGVAHAAEPCADCAVVKDFLTSDVDAFPDNPCRASGKICGATWALTALNMKLPRFQAAFTARADVVSAVVAHLSSANEEQVGAAAWLLCNAVTGSPHLSPAIMAAAEDVAGALVGALQHAPDGPKGLICWAIRALSVGHHAHQTAFWSRGVLAALHPIMKRDSAAKVQADAVWALAAVVDGIPLIQDDVRRVLDGDIVTTVVDLLGSPSCLVQDQAAVAVYNLAARCAENQTLIGTLGAVPKLVAMLLKCQQRARSMERSMAALLCLALKHPENQQRVGRAEGLALHVVQALACSVPRLQGLAAALIRVVTAEQGDLQLVFAGHGALSALLDLTDHREQFPQEQAVAALYNMLAQQAVNKGFLLALSPQARLIALLEDCTKPTRLAYTCTIMVLYVLADGEPSVAAALGHSRPLVDALLRFCHFRCGDIRLRAQADRLLLLISPEDHAQRPTRSPACVLDAMVAVPVHKLGAGAPAFECPICMTGGGEVCMLRCCHAFHLDCLKLLVAHGKENCPLCRDNIVEAIHGVLGSDAVLACCKSETTAGTHAVPLALL